MLSMMLVTILVLCLTISNFFCAAELIGKMIFYFSSFLEFSKNVSYSNVLKFHTLNQWRGATRISSRLDPTFRWTREAIFLKDGPN